MGEVCGVDVCWVSKLAKWQNGIGRHCEVRLTLVWL